jgi:type I restriction enzyme, S subunit
MIGSLNRYLDYRTVPAGWIKDVPVAWKTRRIKALFRESDERIGSSSSVLLSLTRRQGILPQSEASARIASTDDLSKYKRCRPQDLVMNRMQAWSGMFAVSPLDGAISPDYSVFKPTNASIEVRYFEMLFRTPDLVHEFARRSKGIGSGFNRLYTPDFGSIEVLVPSIEEQRAIVRFLDYMDRRIRRYIAAKKKLIALLNEQKQAIIHRAVTRGVDPDVPLKPSGVEWLGDIPEHWSVKRCRYLFQEIDRRSADGSEQHLSMSQRLGLVPSDQVETRTLLSLSYAGGKLCYVGDLVLNRLKAHLGVFAMARHDGVISPDYTVLRPLQSGVEYFESILRSPACRGELRIRAKGIVEGFWRLYTDEFYDIRLPVPPDHERQKIVEYTRLVSRKVDCATESIDQQVSFMREFRARLVADVVTGKLDVREAAARLTDEIEEPVADGDGPFDDLQEDENEPVEEEQALA